MEAKVRAIKVALAKGTNQQELADRFSVAQCTISAIATGRIWKHITT
jgi:transcriptional regulator with XRE-family HTH domain